MSKKKGKTNAKLALLNEINAIDKRLKRFKNEVRWFISAKISSLRVKNAKF